MVGCENEVDNDLYYKFDLDKDIDGVIQLSLLSLGLGVG